MSTCQRDSHEENNWLKSHGSLAGDFTRGRVKQRR